LDNTGKRTRTSWSTDQEEQGALLPTPTLHGSKGPRGKKRKDGRKLLQRIIKEKKTLRYYLGENLIGQDFGSKEGGRRRREGLVQQEFAYVEERSGVSTFQNSWLLSQLREAKNARTEGTIKEEEKLGRQTPI